MSGRDRDYRRDDREPKRPRIDERDAGRGEQGSGRYGQRQDNRRQADDPGGGDRSYHEQQGRGFAGGHQGHRGGRFDQRQGHGGGEGYREHRGGRGEHGRGQGDFGRGRGDFRGGRGRGGGGRGADLPDIVPQTHYPHLADHECVRRPGLRANTTRTEHGQIAHIRCNSKVVDLNMKPKNNKMETTLGSLSAGTDLKLQPRTAYKDGTPVPITWGTPEIGPQQQPLAVYTNSFRLRLNAAKLIMLTVILQDAPRPRQQGAGAGAVDAAPRAVEGQADEAAARQAAAATKIPREKAMLIVDKLVQDLGWRFMYAYDGRAQLLAVDPPEQLMSRGVYTVEYNDGGRRRNYTVDIGATVNSVRDIGELLRPGYRFDRVQAQPILAALDVVVKHTLARVQGCEHMLPNWNAFFFTRTLRGTISRLDDMHELHLGLNPAIRPLTDGTLALNLDLAAKVFQRHENLTVLDVIIAVLLANGHPVRADDAQSWRALMSNRQAIMLVNRRLKILKVTVIALKVPMSLMILLPAPPVVEARVYMTLQRVDKMQGSTNRYKLKSLADCTAETLRPELATEAHPQGRSIAQYNLETYNLRLEYPWVPMVQAGSARSPKLLPPELVKIEAGNEIKKLESRLQAMIPQKAGLPPLQRAAVLDQAINQLGAFVNNARLQDFGISSISPTMMQVPYTVLPPPVLGFKGTPTPTGMQPTDFIAPQPGDTRWTNDADNKAFLAAATLDCFAIISYVDSRQLRTESIQSWFSDLFRVLSSKNMLISPQAEQSLGRLCVFASGRMSVEAAMRDAVTRALTELGKEPQIIFVILAKKGAAEYNPTKIMGDKELGIPTQCIDYNKACLDAGAVQGSNPRAYQNKIALKINAKLGGTNKMLALNKQDMYRDEQLGKWAPNMRFVMETCMVFGVDVTHGPPGSNQPSVAAVVGSLDEHQSQFGVYMAEQERDELVEGKSMRQEIVTSMSQGVKHLLHMYRKRNQQKPLPSCLIVYRDGVSEGEYQQVLEREVTAVRRGSTAFATEDEPRLRQLAQQYGTRPDWLHEQLKQLKAYRPRITFITVQKRHRHKFFLRTGDGSRDWANIKSGTVIDGGVTDSNLFEFFLASQYGMLGHLRAPRYTVIRDESNYTPDFLSLFTYWTTFLFCRCSMPVSLPPVVYYAHLAAARGRVLKGMDSGSDAGSVLSEELQELSVHEHLKARLFYV